MKSMYIYGPSCTNDDAFIYRGGELKKCIEMIV